MHKCRGLDTNSSADKFNSGLVMKPIRLETCLQSILVSMYTLRETSQCLYIREHVVVSSVCKQYWIFHNMADQKGCFSQLQFEEMVILFTSAGKF